MAPEATEAFNGTIELDIRDSEPDWGPYAAPVAPEHSPNILYLVWDDVGIATWDCFGGLVEMPAMTRRRAWRATVAISHHRTVLADPGVAADRSQRHHRRHGYHRRVHRRVPQLQRADPG